MLRHLALRVLPLLLLAGSCLAVTLEELSFEELIDSSALVVRGTVSASSSSQFGRGIETRYLVNVVETLKGASGDPEETTASYSLSVSLPGGAVNGVRQTVAGVPKLETGAEYILFLWRARDGRLLPIGMAQGLFRIERTGGRATARRLPIDGALLDRRTGRALRDSGLDVSVASLRNAVIRRGAARGGRK